MDAYFTYLLNYCTYVHQGNPLVPSLDIQRELRAFVISKIPSHTVRDVKHEAGLDNISLRNIRNVLNQYISNVPFNNIEFTFTLCRIVQGHFDEIVLNDEETLNYIRSAFNMPPLD